MHPSTKILQEKSVLFTEQTKEVHVKGGRGNWKGLPSTLLSCLRQKDDRAPAECAGNTEPDNPSPPPPQTSVKQKASETAPKEEGVACQVPAYLRSG